jgi:predicted ATPase
MQAAHAQAEDFRQAFRVAATRLSALTCESFADTLDDDFGKPRGARVLQRLRAPMS